MIVTVSLSLFWYKHIVGRALSLFVLFPCCHLQSLNHQPYKPINICKITRNVMRPNSVSEHQWISERESPANCSLYTSFKSPGDRENVSRFQTFMLSLDTSGLKMLLWSRRSYDQDIQLFLALITKQLMNNWKKSGAIGCSIKTQKKCELPPRFGEDHIPTNANVTACPFILMHPSVSC